MVVDFFHYFTLLTLLLGIKYLFFRLSEEKSLSKIMMFCFFIEEGLRKCLENYSDQKNDDDAKKKKQRMMIS